MTNPSTGDLFGGANAVPIDLEPQEAAAGVDKAIALPGGRTFTIRIPPGVTDNMVLRLPGADTSDPSGPKDIFLRVHLKPPTAGMPFAGMPFGPSPWTPPADPTSGMPATAPPMSAPPMSAPPMSAPPMSGPPMSGPPMSGPPMSGPPGVGFPPAGAGFPTSGAGFPAVGAPGGWQPGPPVQPSKSSNGKIIGLVAGAVVLVLVLCGGGVYLATNRGDTKNTSAEASAGSSASKGATSSPTPAKPPVSPEEYTQLLAAVDGALGPALQKVPGAKNPTELATAVDGARTTAMEQLSTLDKTSPPELVKQAHNDLVTALGAFATTLNETVSAARDGEICAGAAALAKISSASSVGMVRNAAESYGKLDPAHAYKIGSFLPAPVAEQNRRLGNGTFVKKGNRNGSGKLKIDNTGGTDDAAISVVPANTKASAFTVYVTAGQSFTVSGVRDGNYQIYLTTGADWDPGPPGFTRKCGFSKFADAFEFKTTSSQYTQWTITLKASVGGNARTDEVPPGDFPTG
jgi:hypothetical protein